MSGGSWDYMCYKDVPDMAPSWSHWQTMLDSMADRLRSIGAEDAAAETAAFSARLEAIGKEIDRLEAITNALYSDWSAIDRDDTDRISGREVIDLASGYCSTYDCTLLEAMTIMAEHLRARGRAEKATATEALVQPLEALRQEIEKLDRESQTIRFLWKAVEWWDSLDSSEESFMRRDLPEYRETRRKEPPLQPPVPSAAPAQ